MDTPRQIWRKIKTIKGQELMCLAREVCNSTTVVQSGTDRGERRTFSLKSDCTADKKNVKSNLKDKLYRLTYYVGVQVLRLKRRLMKHTKRNMLVLGGYLKQSTKVYFIKTKAAIRTLDRDLLFPIKKLSRNCVKFAEEQKVAFKKGIVDFLLFYLATAKDVVIWTFRKSGKIFSYVAPVVAIALFVSIVNEFMGQTYALKVSYNGEDIGYINSEADFETAEKRMKARIIYEDYVKPEDAVPRFTLMTVENELMTKTNELTDRLIRSSGNELADASGLYIGGEFMGATTDPNSMLLMLDAMKQEYSTGDPTERVDFVKDVRLVQGLYPLTSIVELDSIQTELKKDEEEQRMYTVQKGDAPTVIAQKYNMKYSDLKALNPTIEKSLLVGQEVLISRSVPFLAVQTTKTVVEEEDIAFKIEQTLDKNYNQGYTKVMQVGKKGVKEARYQITYVDGVETERVLLDSKIVKEPTTEKIIVGGNKPLQQITTGGGTSSSNFIRPVIGGYVSAGLYGYRGHTGMDIAVPIGTPVRAAASGTVIVSKYWGGAYGHYVKIDHGGGVQTLYAHNSKLNVSVGDFVQQGQQIAAVGMTGRTSGPHCHFEVIINGRIQDPAKYIGSK